MSNVSATLEAPAIRPGPTGHQPRRRISLMTPLTYLVALLIVGITVIPLLFVIVDGFRSNAQINTSATGLPHPRDFVDADDISWDRHASRPWNVWHASVPRSSVFWGKYAFSLVVGLAQLMLFFVYGNLIFRIDAFRDPVTLVVLCATWSRTGRWRDFKACFGINCLGPIRKC